jgi:hypothetical protein
MDKPLDHRWFLLKMVSMGVFILADLGLNSSLEFDDYVGDVTPGTLS